MLRYEILINDETCVCYFLNHVEANNFLDECELFGDEATPLSYTRLSVEELKSEPNLGHSEMIEYLGMMLLPNCREFKKWSHIEAELNRLGLL